MLRTMFTLVLPYALIFSLVPLFLEGGVTFSFNFKAFICYVIFSIVYYCMGFEPAIECE